MPFDISAVGEQIGQTILDSLKMDGGRVKAMAMAEGEKLSLALAKIAEMRAQQQIDDEETALLVRVQRDASEVVLASLAEVSRLAASKAVMLGLQVVAGAVDAASGVPILGPLFTVVTA